MKRASLPARATAEKKVRQAVVTAQTTKKTKADGTEVLREDHVRSEAEGLDDIRHTASVTVSGGVTKSLGDYEFVRCDVSITMPCLPTMDGPGGVVETKELVSAKVDEFVREEVALAMGE